MVGVYAHTEKHMPLSSWLKPPTKWWLVGVENCSTVVANYPHEDEDDGNSDKDTGK